jgi:hypothetical protein
MMQGTNIFVNDCPKFPTEMEEMTKVPYTSAVSNLMYVMTCTRPYITQAMGILSHFMANPR